MRIIDPLRTVHYAEIKDITPAAWSVRIFISFGPCFWFSSFAIEALFSNLPKAFDTNLLVSILVLVGESVSQ